MRAAYTTCATHISPGVEADMPLMNPRSSSFGVLLLALGLMPFGIVGGQAQRFPLASVAGLHAVNVTLAADSHKGRPGVRVVADTAGATAEYLVGLDGQDFSNGAIEAEVAGAPRPRAFEAAR